MREEKIEFLLSDTDIIHFKTVFEHRFGVLRYRSFTLPFLGCISVVLFLIWLFSANRVYNSMNQLFVVSFIFFIIYCVYGFLYVPKAVQNQARRLYLSGADYSSVRQVEFFGEVMRVSRKFTRDTYDLNDFCCCVDTLTHFCLYKNPKEAEGEVIPKSVLTQQQSESISSKMKEIFGKAYIRL